MRSHSGEVSFPGGKLEDIDDNNVVNCAIRETKEELGIHETDKDNILVPLANFHELPSKTGIVGMNNKIFTFQLKLNIFLKNVKSLLLLVL